MKNNGSSEIIGTSPALQKVTEQLERLKMKHRLNHLDETKLLQALSHLENGESMGDCLLLLSEERPQVREVFSQLAEIYRPNGTE